ncbi:MAG: glycosyltransferase family 4 protein [Bacteroides sp.]|nr:glycosyltransferase family 4 protein [Bacteroides sp.]
MKIIFCDNSIRSFVNFRIDVAEYYIQQGNDVYLIYPKCTFENGFEELLPKGCHVLQVDMNPSNMSVLQDVKTFYQLFSIYKEIKPDIIFHYTIKPNIYGTIAAKLIGVKTVSMVAGLGYMFTGNGLTKQLGRFMYKLGLRYSSWTIVLNSSNYKTLFEKGYIKSNRCSLFSGGEGVNLKRFKYVEKEYSTIRFLMVARILYDKGYTEYVEAASIVKNKYSNISFDLLGPIDETNPTGVPKHVIDKDVLDGKINYLGVTSDVASYLEKDNTVVVIPSSYNEGLNHSLMEACAMGCPIITTDIPGCRETVEDGINGYLLQSKDVQTLASKMLNFIELPQKNKQEMSNASYLKAKKEFDIINVIKQYDEIINNLL